MKTSNGSVRVILVKISIGRGTIIKCPLNQDQLTNILMVEKKDKNYGMMIEMIPAIKKFNCYYRIIKMPNLTEITGDVFYNAKDYMELTDTPLIRAGLIKFIDQINKQVVTHLKIMQKSKKTIENYFESYA